MFLNKDSIMYDIIKYLFFIYNKYIISIFFINNSFAIIYPSLLLICQLNYKKNPVLFSLNFFHFFFFNFFKHFILNIH